MQVVRRKRGERGNSIVEVALLAPWIFFLFVGIFDLGFYAYAIICTENAARAAATQTASSVGVQSASIACDAAWNELKGLPNVAGTSENCTQLPVVVTQKTLCDSTKVQPTTLASYCASGSSCADCGSSSDPNSHSASSQVAVQYQSIPLVPIPGILTGRMTITRIVEMRVIAE
jgi:Flp pilus assembly protein TadG